MTAEQRDAVVDRAWNTLLELGGVSYAIVKLAPPAPRSSTCVDYTDNPRARWDAEGRGRRAGPAASTMESPPMEPDRARCEGSI
jgi:hypothetical protein